MAKYLVTGGAGFIGSNLTSELIKKNNEVYIVDDLSMGKLENLEKIEGKRIHFYKHSITDYAFVTELLVKERFDYVILLAAVASVAESVTKPYTTHLVNQEANINVLETIRKYKLPIKKLIFSSSAAVYGNTKEIPKKETSKINPLTPYAIDKYATERFVLIYGRLYGIPVIVTRFFNVYGPKQNPRSIYSGVISIMINSLITNDSFTLFGDGSQTRDFIYVSDVVQALIMLLNSKQKFGIYNIATGHSTNLIEVVELVQRLVGKQLRIIREPKRVGDIYNSVADICAIKQVGFSPKYSMEVGLKKYLEFEKLC